MWEKQCCRFFVCVCLCGRGGPLFPGDLSGLCCLSIRAGAIRPSESGSIPSHYCDKIKAFQRPEQSLPCSLAHNVLPLKHPVVMELQLCPFKSFLSPVVPLGHWHACTKTHNSLAWCLINSFTCTLPSGTLCLSQTHVYWCRDTEVLVSGWDSRSCGFTADRTVRRSPSHCQCRRADDRWQTETLWILDIISLPDFGFKHKDRQTQRRLTARNTQTDTCTALTLISINKQSLVVVKILCQTNPAPPFFIESSFGHFQTFISWHLSSETNAHKPTTLKPWNA